MSDSGGEKPCPNSPSFSVKNKKVSLPVRFSNPEVSISERPISDVTPERKQLVTDTELLLGNVDQTLTGVNDLLNFSEDLTINLLNQNINELLVTKMSEFESVENLERNSEETSRVRNKSMHSTITGPHTLLPIDEDDAISFSDALKLLPKTCDGTDIEELEEFLEQCDFAMSVVQEKSKPRMLKGILLRLKGRAKGAIRCRTIQNWPELHHILKTSLQPQRTVPHMYMELYSSKQKPDEDVLAYSTRIETLQNLILEQEVSGKTTEVAEGISNSLKAQTTQIFIEGLGKLKHFIKSRNPITLEQAICQAREEERVQQSAAESRRFYENLKNSSKNTGKKKPSKPCFHCKKNGHWSNECRYAPGSSTEKKTESKEIRPANVRTVTCGYCKKSGHSTQDCRKLKQKNLKTNSDNGTTSTSGNGAQSYVTGGRTAGSIKTAAISFPQTS